MGTKRVWTLKEIAKETGYSRVTIHTDYINGVMHAKRANPGKTKIKLFHGPALAEYIQKQKAKKAAARVAKPRPSRAGQNSQRRQKQIERLREIIENQTEVSAEEKEDALLYYDRLSAVVDSMVDLYFGRWWIGPWKMNPKYRIPLLQGIHALFEDKFVFGYGESDAIVVLKSEIERLPTRSKPTPQTEQSSLNASDK